MCGGEVLCEKKKRNLKLSSVYETAGSKRRWNCKKKTSRIWTSRYISLFERRTGTTSNPRGEWMHEHVALINESNVTSYLVAKSVIQSLHKTYKKMSGGVTKHSHVTYCTVQTVLYSSGFKVLLTWSLPLLWLLCVNQLGPSSLVEGAVLRKHKKT